MEVILLQNVPTLGKKNEIKRVADGYALNFLVPKKLACLATSAKKTELAKLQEKVILNKTETLAHLDEIVQKIKTLGKLAFTVKATKTGKLYAAITEEKIAEHLQEKIKASLESKQIILATAIKTTGEHSATIRLNQNKECTLKIVVEAEKTN
ncbi:50S ribosomal protein L9 [Candidatus Peregrinibacteria bacterium CG08_land_8_20_14_0_20_41_10]|nr:MAG: 50S ribosomal protein L9 [Candidatus Peregrinibacteria bacterium CG1_02_41_10]PIS32383.1 MAG: 50S ribosomal protein L9 [Candidatus Peregrinibacteria bacterium CG08_land_8_20_14_0_20_41_10]